MKMASLWRIGYIYSLPFSTEKNLKVLKKKQMWLITFPQMGANKSPAEGFFSPAERLMESKRGRCLIQQLFQAG